MSMIKLPMNFQEFLDHPYMAKEMIEFNINSGSQEDDYSDIKNVTLEQLFHDYLSSPFNGQNFIWPIDPNALKL